MALTAVNVYVFFFRDDTAVHKDGRATGAESLEHLSGWQGVTPKLLAGQVVAEDAIGAEIDDQPFAIRGRSRISIAGFDVAFDLRRTFVDGFFPDDAASLLVETVDAPTVLRIIVR